MGFPSIKIFVCIHTVVCWCGGEALKVIILPLRLSEGVVCCTPTIFKPILGRKEIYLPPLFLFLTFQLPSRHWIVKPLFLSRALSRLLREIRGSVDRLGISCRELTFEFSEKPGRSIVNTHYVYFHFFCDYLQKKYIYQTILRCAYPIIYKTSTSLETV